ncbi:MAG: hypothetical protein AB7O50_08775 [Pseudolabrys sp.]
MYRAGIVLGAAVDLVFVVALLAVTGRVVATWSAGPANVATVVTGAWAVGLIVAASAPALAYGLSRRNAPPARVLSILWLPVLLLATLAVAALIVSPPK